jgi:uncharacterized glyoxalase superfamily protein PhnB
MHAKHITPILNVSDLIASFDWFAKLGWRECWRWSENEAFAATRPTFGAVGSGECQIFLCLNAQGGRGKSTLKVTSGPDGSDDQEKGVWMSVWVESPDELMRIHTRCVEQGLDVTWPPTDEPWGVREFHLRHPDGHVFRISANTKVHKL